MAIKLITVLAFVVFRHFSVFTLFICNFAFISHLFSNHIHISVNFAFQFMHFLCQIVNKTQL